MKKRMPVKRRNRFMFILVTAAILLVALATSSVLEFFLVRFAVINYNTGWYWVLIFPTTSIIIGLLLAAIFGRVIFKPIDTVLDGMSRLSNGDFSARVDLEKYTGMKDLSNTFNKLARELENTELLRSNFINEFSHELKTPIVSISGLISLLKNDELPETKRLQYLSIMEAEASRLTQMTNNALYLSKLETQSILTGKSEFNVSEQIRACVLLLVRKWEAKDLTPSLELGEHVITANEDMLMQVWINLIDNAIKFANRGTELEITSALSDGKLSVTVTNDGPPISESERALIFTKFYQCDKTRSTEGNGIGLSIVKHIVDLHEGEISAYSDGGKTSFTVVLPMAT